MVIEDVDNQATRMESGALLISDEETRERHDLHIVISSDLSGVIYKCEEICVSKGRSLLCVFNASAVCLA